MRTQAQEVQECNTPQEELLTEEPTAAQDTATYSYGVVCCSISNTACGEIQLTPDGEFKSSDGRPKDLKHWVMNAKVATAVIKKAQERQNDFVLDYEHSSVQGTGESPAAGWWQAKDLIHRPGKGLFAHVKLTEKAKGYIERNEYRYVSAVFSYSDTTGEVEQIHSAALTNNPAIDGMKSIELLRKTQGKTSSSPGASTSENLAACNTTSTKESNAQTRRLIEQGMQAGKVFPAQRAALSALSPAQMQDYLDSTPVYAMLGAQQSQVPQSNTAQCRLSPADEEMIARLKLDRSQFVAAKQQR